MRRAQVGGSKGEFGGGDRVLRRPRDFSRYLRSASHGGGLSGFFPENHHYSGSEAVHGACHGRTHEKKFEECCRCKETTVRLRAGQKAHELGLEIHRLSTVPDCTRIVCTPVRRTNLVSVTLIHS